MSRPLGALCAGLQQQHTQQQHQQDCLSAASNAVKAPVGPTFHMMTAAEAPSKGCLTAHAELPCAPLPRSVKSVSCARVMMVLAQYCTLLCASKLPPSRWDRLAAAVEVASGSSVATDGTVSCTTAVPVGVDVESRPHALVIAHAQQAHSQRALA